MIIIMNKEFLSTNTNISPRNLLPQKLVLETKTTTECKQVEARYGQKKDSDSNQQNPRRGFNEKGEGGRWKIVK